MNKDKVRALKFHYLSRWSLFRHNQKNVDKTLLFADLFVIKNLSKGTTLFYDCLGEIYQGIVLNSTCDPAGQTYDNLVLVNNPVFKYKTIVEIATVVDQLATKFLAPGGRVVLSFEHRGIIYDRVHQSVTSLLHEFTEYLTGYTVLQSANLLTKAPPGYGDYFFCLTKNA